MKKLTIATGIIALTASLSVTAAEVTVRQIPLEWEATANPDGNALYNGLCSTCHGINGNGNGPAAGAVEKEVPDLRMLTIKNGGVYPHQSVERAIRGDSREIVHGTIDMPNWEQQFMYVKPGWNTFMRKAYARRRIHALDTYIETLQVDITRGQEKR
jgi:mono/diheme cytochrome c family protein